MSKRIKTVCITGCAGFIGSHTTMAYLARGYRVIGIDNMNDHYDVRLKKRRLAQFKSHKRFVFKRVDIENLASLKRIFKEYSFEAVINLAARAGVHHSLKNPHVYFSTNASGVVNLLEMCRTYGVKKFILASTSSLYAGQKPPFKESMAVNEPISPYAASKKAAEATAYAYHHLYGIDVSILRFFTAFGPYGRPDMSMIRFIRWIDEGRPLTVFGNGSQQRDFTYIDDIVRGIIKAQKKLGFEVINLGHNHPHSLKDMIRIIETYLDKKAKYNYLPFHQADLPKAWANINKADKLLRWRPQVGFEKGIKKTVAWYQEHQCWFKDIILET